MRNILLLMVCVFCADVVFGEERLTWKDCLQEVRQYHPELVAAKAKLDAVKADGRIVRSGILPRVSASAGADTGKTEGKKKSDSYSYGVSGRQLLFDGSATAHNLAAAGERVKVSSYELQVVSSNVRFYLETAFIGLLGAQENVAVIKNILERRKQNFDLVTLQYKGGRAHKGALLTSEANVAQAQLDLVIALRNVELYQRRLVKALGRRKFSPLVADGELKVHEIDREKPDFESLVETVPLLKEFAARKEASRFGLKSAKSDFFPQVFADAGLRRDSGSWPPETNSWSAGVSVTLPLFQGGQQQAALAKAGAVYRQSELDEVTGRMSVVLALAEAWTVWLNAVDQQAVQEKFYLAAKQRADIFEAQYRSGLAGFDDWTLIEDELVRNQKVLLQAKTGALISGAAWLQAKGETIDE